MRITIAAVGKLKRGPESELASRYIDRLKASGRNVGMTGVAVVEVSESRRQDVAGRKAEEAAALSRHIPDGATLIALDETGKSRSSSDLARTVGRLADEGTGDLVFLIGGPDGLDPDLRKRAGTRMAFGAATWPHQLVRVMLAEQLYRAATILSGHPYHRA